MVRQIQPIEVPGVEALDADPRVASVSFAPNRVAPHRAGPPVIVLAWLGCLAGVVLVAGLGTDAGSGRVRPPAVAAATAPGTFRPAVNPIHLQVPEAGPITLTSPRLTVVGLLRAHAARVVVSLEARGNRTLESTVIDVSDPHGGVRPDRSPTFTAEFEIPFPRPNGTMWVVVTAYDSRGMPLGGERRPVRIGPLLTGMR